MYMIYRICEMSLHTLPRESTVNKKESVVWRKTVSGIRWIILRLHLAPLRRTEFIYDK